MADKTFSVEVTGVKEVVAVFERLSKDAPHAMAIQLVKEAEGLITEAKKETPVLTGALRASGHVLPPTIQGSNVTVECGFGGSAVGYALYVHENLEAKHINGKAKYLSDPFYRRINGLDQRVAQGMKQQLAV